MSSIVIRAIWGIYDKSERTVARRYNVDRDIQKIIDNVLEIPFVVYGFGEKNCKQMSDLGMDVYMIDKNPAPFDLVNHHYRNKLEIFRYVMEVDGFDEILFLDWDCSPVKVVPDDMWNIFHKKEPIQANLQQYHRRKCTWRPTDMRKLPNAGFVYIGDKSIPQKIIKAWELNPGNSAEPPMGRVMDELSGGWKGKDYYWEHYEPELCNLHRASVYPNAMIASKNYCYVHTQGQNRTRR